MNKLPLALVALALLGCGPTLVYKGTGATRPAKPPTCDFAVLKATPTQAYEELGTINIQYDNTGFIDKPEVLKKRLQPEVCKVGGDAVLPVSNDYGTYTQAKVLTYQITEKAETVPSEDAQGDSVPEAKKSAGSELEI